MAKDPNVKFVKLAPLTLRHEYVNNEGIDDYGTLSWGIKAGYPRIMVYTSNVKKKGYESTFDYNTFIRAPFDYVTLGILIQRLNELVNSTEEAVYTIDCFNIKFVNNVKTNEVYLQAKVIIGRDAEGIIYISVVDDTKRKLKFTLLPSDKWFAIYDKLGNIITDKKVLSTLYARSYVNLLSRVTEKEAHVDMLKTSQPVVNNTYTKPTQQVPVVNTETKSENGNIDFTSSIAELM